ncbi:sugar phosphate isomerase/epimerase family protein [Neorhizobium sp. S3-V5DH]|uniref:sugar phosphate isomerase/epimerase family protein n=1 Tax=Neorhizobium sp. S3-V5DH TaxID=2485166 RepID=UPI00104886C9|nr:sugar phosphate isomerase/epimerase family protein [Neorhizobium sp. S3-V5DH]TCV68598.1 3-dehydroshikimate dehydratase [Neorhizobium sp. S3-V5DH]
MKLSICSISFRHHLMSLGEMAAWARSAGFQGIELWGVHARNLAAHPERNGAWLEDYGLSVPMISDYLPLDADARSVRQKTNELCQLARNWGTSKIRTFAGSTASKMACAEERSLIADRLRDVCDVTANYGIYLLAETHPNTLADTSASTLQLIYEVDHPFFAINFDALHVWEGGDDPVAIRQRMGAAIRHYHLKNVRHRKDLGVFEPANVYAPGGDRRGMTSLFEGALDYSRFLSDLIGDTGAEASLEWFGDDCLEMLRNDLTKVRQLASRQPKSASNHHRLEASLPNL